MSTAGLVRQIIIGIGEALMAITRPRRPMPPRVHVEHVPTPEETEKKLRELQARARRERR